MLTKLLKNRLFPRVLQWLTVLSFLAVLGFLLMGESDRDNPANLLVWLIWWPLLCVIFLVAGRFWCGICPFSLISDWIQRAAGVRLAVPEFLKQYGGWIILLAFLLLSWFEETTGIVDSPRKTAAMLLFILTGAVAFGLFIRGRAWCRYVCPLGGISLVYARTSLFKLRASEAACAECLTKDCVIPDAGYSGCPMHLTPFAMDSVANCNFCGACVKRCPNNSLQVAFEAPSRDLSAQAATAPVVIWLIVLLAGMISFLNSQESGRLPVEEWIKHASQPVLLKTALLAGALAASCFLFGGLVRLAARAAPDLPRQQLLQAGALPMIPLLLCSHLGHVCSELWADGGHLLAPLATTVGLKWLGMDALWGATWTTYFSPACIVTGLALSLGILRWTLGRESALQIRRTGLYFGLFYLVFAGWNLFAIWPHAAGPAATVAEGVKAAAVVAETESGWSILWPFFGINATLLALALIVRHFELGSGASVKNVDFSASNSWVIRDSTGSRQSELLEWLLGQAVQERWHVPQVVGLANASAEIVTFLQRSLPAGARITINANFRKNRGVMTISHEGRPLVLPNYKAVTNLENADDAALEGIELRLAVAQVEYMSYHARLSEARCSFTLRQTC